MNRHNSQILEKRLAERKEQRRNELKSTARTVVAVLLAGVGSIMMYDQLTPEKAPKPFSEFYDANGDGRPDFVYFDGTREHISINMPEGWIPVEVKVQDGIPFYVSENGCFDSWGHYFGNNFTARNLKHHTQY